MGEKKRVPRIALVMAAALLLVGICIGLACTAGYSKDTELKEPEYMSKLFDKDKVLEVNINISESDFEDLKENTTDEKYYRSDITIDGVTYSNVGIRAKGNSSLSQVAGDDTTDRYSFKIKTDEYIDNQNIYGLSKFVFNNNIGDATSMKEYMSYDLLNQMGIATPGFAYADIKINNQDWGLYLAVESLEEEFVNRTYGNTDGNLYKVETSAMGKENKGGMPEDMDEKGGEQGGRHMMQGQQGNAQMQPPQGDEQMPQGNPPDMQGSNETENNEDTQQGFPGGPGGGGPGGMSGKGGNLVYSDDEISSYSNIFDYTILKTTTNSDKKRLISIIKNLNEGTNLDESIDVDEVLKYFAVNTYLVNLDSYAGSMKHNYYIYENDGKMQILPWDYNLAYGAFMMGGMGKGQMGNKGDNNSSQNSQTLQAINFPIDMPVTDSMENSPLISKFLEVDEYKEKYHEYLQEIVDKYVNTGYFEEEIDKVDSLIASYVEKDATAFFTYDEYKASLPNLKQYGVDRGESIQAQLDGDQPSESYGNLESTVDIKALGQQMGGGPKGEENAEQGGFDKMPGNDRHGNQNAQGMNSPDMKENQGDNKKQMMPPGMQNKEEESSLNIGGMNVPASVAVAAGCFLVMIIALIFANNFRRKREYCK